MNCFGFTILSRGCVLADAGAMGVHDVFLYQEQVRGGKSDASGDADVFEKLGVTNHEGTGRLQIDPPEYQRYKSAAS